MSGRWAVLGFLVALSIITYLDRVCISVAGVRIQEDLGIAPEHWGWVLGVFSIAYGLFEIPTGAWGDRYGQRRVLTRIVVWWSAFVILTGFASSFGLLLLTRFLFGMGEAGAYPNMAGTIGRWFSSTERARAQGAIWAASRVGGALSPLIVGPMMASMGWRPAFYVFGCVGVVWALLWSAWYRDPPSGEASPSSHAEMPWAELLRSRQFWIILAMAWCYGWGAIFFLSWFPTYLEKARGLSEKELTYCAALPFVMGAIGNLAGGAITDRLSRAYGLKTGRRLVGSVSLALSSLFFLTTALTSGKVVGVIALTLGYGAMDCMLPASWANCVDMGGRHGGAVSGAMNSVVQVGGFLSTVLFGYLMRSSGSYNAPLFVIAPMLLISAVLFARIDPTRPLIPATPGKEEVVCA
jgi:MFS transporter, ACS family, glucarate transporter